MIQDLLNDVILKDGETLRLNCPSCGGYKTFTITKLSGSTVWNCYKASCNLKGGKGSTYSLKAYQGLRNTGTSRSCIRLASLVHSGHTRPHD
jgi:hypothetical protein